MSEVIETYLCSYFKSDGSDLEAGEESSRNTYSLGFVVVIAYSEFSIWVAIRCPLFLLDSVVPLAAFVSATKLPGCRTRIDRPIWLLGF